MQNFIDWVLQEMKNRDWAIADLARKGEMKEPTISRVLNQHRNPGIDTCHGIARAFRIPPETVLRRAGLLPPKPAEDEVTEELLLLYSHLPPTVQDDLLEMIRALEHKHAPRANHKKT